jgi:hypothetical protein
MSGLISMPRKHILPYTLLKTCDSDMDSPWKADKEQTRFQAPETRLSHICQIAKGVWLEMADYLGHFLDMQLLRIFAQSNPVPPSHLKILQRF